MIGRCLGPAPLPGGTAVYDDGLRPVGVQVEFVLKGDRRPGKTRVATIYPMEAGRTYLLMNGGGLVDGIDFVAVPQLSVVEVPNGFSLAGLERKASVEQVRAVFAARRQENERQRRGLEAERELLDKAAK